MFYDYLKPTTTSPLTGGYCCSSSCMEENMWVCGGLWHASLVRGSHEQKSMVEHGAACSARLYTGLRSVGPASCFMHLHAAWTQSADARWELLPSICIVFTALREGKQFAAIVRLICNQDLCTWEIRDTEESIATTLWYEYFIFVLYE